MNGDEVSGDNQPEETAVRLRTGLKSCREMIASYRAMLSGESKAGSAARPIETIQRPEMRD